MKIILRMGTEFYKYSVEHFLQQRKSHDDRKSSIVAGGRESPDTADANRILHPIWLRTCQIRKNRGNVLL